MTRDEVVARLSRRLAERSRATMQIDGFRRAGVLVPLLDAPSGLELLFTVRASTLPHHPGQIAFPGGGLERREGVVAAALREAREEIGIEVERDVVLGCLDDHPSPARYVATPVVALIRWPQPTRLNRAEVDEVFTAPLAELLTLSPTSEERQLLEYRRRLYSYGWRGRTIWGFTGNVLKELLDLLL